MTDATPFQRLLQAAGAQAEPQRLLFVFAAAELPPDASAEQRRRFEAGEGGTLTPLACVDRAPEELAAFEALREESRQACPPWQVVFIAGLGGRGGQPPPVALVDSALQRMVADVEAGRIDHYLALDAAGHDLQFH